MPRPEKGPPPRTKPAIEAPGKGRTAPSRRSPKPLITPWTDADRDRLRALAAAGLQPLQIALKMTRTVGAITTRAKTLGLRLKARRDRARAAGEG